jgi:prevent-host-death family protein
MRNIIPITDLQQKTKKFVERVRATGVPIIITQRGRAAAILASAEDFEGYLIALDEMSYLDWRVKLSRATKQLDAGEGIELETLVKEEKKRKRRGSDSQTVSVAGSLRRLPVNRGAAPDESHSAPPDA